MQKWEYKMVKNIMMTEDELNRLGREGWELVTYNYDDNRYIFKRPKS